MSSPIAPLWLAGAYLFRGAKAIRTSRAYVSRYTIAGAGGTSSLSPGPSAVRGSAIRYEGPPFSPFSLRSLSQSSYFWPLGMVAPVSDLTLSSCS